MALSGTALGVKKVNDPRKFGVAEFDDIGNIIKVVEKPSIPKSNMALVGLYKIKEFDILIKSLEYNIKNDIRSSNNEFYLTDGLQEMLLRGVKMEGYKVDNWYDCGQKEVLLKTNALLLNKRKKLHLTKEFAKLYCH